MKMNEFRFHSAAPGAARGIPAPRLAFSGGRTAVQLASHGGICELRYYGCVKIRNAVLFEADPLSGWAQLFRPLIDFGGGDRYLLEFRNSVFYPFGYDSEFEVHGRLFRHRLTVLNDALIFELEQPEDAVDDFSLLVIQGTAAVRRALPGRSWSDFRQRDGENFALAACCDRDGETPAAGGALTQTPINAEPSEGECRLLFGGSGDLSFRRGSHFGKEYFMTRARRGYAAQALILAPDEDAAIRRWRELERNPAAAARHERQAFRTAVRRCTRLRSPRPVLDSFVRNFPEVIRSLAVKDLPGAVRAADSGYWVWGWDGMVHSDALMLAGEWEAIRERLRYYRDTADPELGIFHAVTCTGKPLLAMSPAAQTIYVVMLYNYWLFSRDAAAVREFYPFARKLIERSGRDLVPGTGLYRGTALYPDFPESLGQTGDDLASFNNSIIFQALRCLAVIARELGETADARRFDRAGDELAAGFRRCFYDPSCGYFFDSVDASTLEPRRFYPVYAILRLTSFADELTRGVEAETAAFMEREFTQRTGVSMFARRDPVFYSDGNQLGMYMSVTEGLYRRLLARQGRPDTLLPVIEREWSRLELPEAQSCEAVNSGLAPDNPGRKQQFTAASYYSLTFGVFCGLEFTPEQLLFRRPSRAGERWRIDRLRWGKAVLGIDFRSGGAADIALELNGRRLSGCGISYHELKVGNNQITVYV